MKYDIAKFINPKDPLYLAGIRAIEKRKYQDLESIVNHPDFDNTSFEAYALLMAAADNAYLKGFQLLGDAGVRLFSPLKIHKVRPHIFSNPFQPKDVVLSSDENPLHVLLKKLNICAYSNIKLGEHLKKDDITRALNNYSSRAQGTPLDIAWNQHIETIDFLTQQMKRDGKILTFAPDSFSAFFEEMQYYYPDLTAPTIAFEPMLFQKAIAKEDPLTLQTCSNLTLLSLNQTDYKFSQDEYNHLSRFAEPELVEEMNLADGVQRMPQKIATHSNAKGFIQKVREFFRT